MKCPFELPVITNVSTGDSDRRYVTGVKGFPFICGDIFPKEYADYIVQAINSHEKLLNTLGIANKCLLRAMLKLDTSQYDHDLQIIEQALKEQEKQ